MKNYKLLAVFLSVLLVGGCADTVTFTQAMQVEPVGFWYGIWHGMTFPFSFVGSLFSDVAIYAIYNNGGWYDFGFFLGVGGFSASMWSSKN